MQLVSIFAEATGGSSISGFLSSLQKTIANYGSIVVSIIGIAMVIIGIYKIAKNLMSAGKGQTNWVVAIALVVIGGALAIVGGWAFVGKFANTTKTTLNDMAEGHADTGGGVADPFAEKGGTGGGDGSGG